MIRFNWFLVIFQLFLLLCASSVNGQNAPNCLSLHNGVFYHYPKASNTYSVFLRQDSIQKEVLLQTGDTSVWSVKWKDGCHYELRFLASQGAFGTVAKAYGHELVIEVTVLNSTPDFYVYEAVNKAKLRSPVIQDTIWLNAQPSRVLQRNILEASFPGGNSAWIQYLNGALDKHNKQLSRSKKGGVCLIRFVIDIDGSVSDVEAITMQDSPIGRYAVEAIKKGPKWIPGTMDGKPIKSPKLQPVDFTLEEP